MIKDNLGTFLLGFTTGIFSIGTVVCGLYFYGNRKYRKESPRNGETINDSH